jgi:hypothetical protein
MMTRTDPAITNRLEPKPFDYWPLGADAADEMRDRTSRIRDIQRASVLGVGRELISAKRQEEHGCFLAWRRVTPNTSPPDLDGENDE